MSKVKTVSYKEAEAWMFWGEKNYLKKNQLAITYFPYNIKSQVIRKLNYLREHNKSK